MTLYYCRPFLVYCPRDAITITFEEAKKKANYYVDRNDCIGNVLGKQYVKEYKEYNQAHFNFHHVKLCDVENRKEAFCVIKEFLKVNELEFEYTQIDHSRDNSIEICLFDNPYTDYGRQIHFLLAWDKLKYDFGVVPYTYDRATNRLRDLDFDGDYPDYNDLLLEKFYNSVKQNS